ncbi:F0F1 ATP synthase subunit delta [Vibrio scophthalmi]|uniref:ATP synthase subunit delta n=1 Tax=Vibrio scophthalmi TaxID=45658 RepID=A0A1C7FBD8_9VIBR|nr:F0F1 ATP synthase subunit delta [Vibrio scophthalmi]ANU37057.1 ATP synthase subunit delta [Vibrio scophthalmi]
MSDIQTIAYPYAKAAFDFAKESDALDEWMVGLNLVANVMEQPSLRPQVKALEQGGKSEADNFLHLLFSICDGFIDLHTQNLLKLMAENQRLVVMRSVAEIFTQLKDDNDLRLDVTVSTSEPLDDEQYEELLQALEKKFDRHINLTSKIDKSLIGGIVVQAGELVIDGSLQTSIQRLATNLHV